MTGLMLAVVIVVIAAAIAALEMRNLSRAFAAAAVGGAAFIAGLFLLRAPGVAVLPLVVAALLVWMLAKSGAEGNPGQAGGDLAGLVVGLILLAVVLVLSAGAFSGMPAMGAAPFVSNAGSPAASYGSTNFLAVLFSYRLLDALGAAVVIVTAVAVWLAVRAMEGAGAAGGGKA